MKQLLLVIAFFPAWTHADLNLTDISKAISEGNADALGQFFDQSVEVAIPGAEDMYDKAKAVGVVKDFFTKNKPKTFSQVHQGSSSGSASQYCIGNLVTASGNFRVYIYMKASNGKQLIQELRFDKE